MFVIERMDLPGKGDSFRFFSYDEKGHLLSVKAKGDGKTFKNGDNVTDDLIISSGPPNDAQLTRWKNIDNRIEKSRVDLSLFDTTEYTTSEEQTLKNEEEVAKVETGLDDLTPTEKEQVIKARLGQSDFRKKVLDLYKRTCVVTNIEERTDGPSILIASHIKAWSDCTNANEKLDELMRYFYRLILINYLIGI